MRYDLSKVSRETLEELAECFVKAYLTDAVNITFFLKPEYDINALGEDPCVITNLLKESRAMLRTRAEVNADIAKLVMQCYPDPVPNTELRPLLEEETSD